MLLLTRRNFISTPFVVDSKEDFEHTLFLTFFYCAPFLLVLDRLEVEGEYRAFFVVDSKEDLEFVQTGWVMEVHATHETGLRVKDAEGKVVGRKENNVDRRLEICAYFKGNGLTDKAIERNFADKVCTLTIFLVLTCHPFLRNFIKDYVHRFILFSSLFILCKVI